MPKVRLTQLISLLLFITAFTLTLGAAHRSTPTAYASDETEEAGVQALTRGREVATPAAAGQIAFFISSEWRTASAATATDAQGGKHLVYTHYEGLAQGVPTYGVYLFCPSSCDDGAQWNGVGMGERVNEIQLSLTPQGRPRILYRVANGSNGFDFYYAVCDSNCTNPVQWTVAYITSSQSVAPLELVDNEMPQRYFGLDHLGRPRFVYNDRLNTHYGTFYTFCDVNCTDNSNWQDVRINKDNGGVGPFRDEDFTYPTLTFSASGQPRVATAGATMQDEFFLFYVACDSSCHLAASWVTVPLFPRGFGHEISYDIEVNTQGKPRIAFYEAGQPNNEGNRLWYIWCNSLCTQSASWSRSQIGLPRLEGQEPDLEFDAGGRPHIAYALFLDGGLGYSTCDANCESTGAQWKHQVVENRSDLFTAWPVAHPLHCSGGIWDGLTPSLSIDTAGFANVAYDVTYSARCHYDSDNDTWEPWHVMNLVWRSGRIVTFKPGSTTPTAVTVTQHSAQPLMTSSTLLALTLVALLGPALIAYGRSAAARNR